MLVKKLESNTVGEDKYLVTLDIRDTATKIGVDSRIVLDALLGYDPQVTYYGTLSSSEYFKGLSEQCQTLPENYKRAFKLDDIVLRLSEKAIRLDATKSIVTVSIIVSNTTFVGDLTHPGWTLVPAIAKIDSNEVDTYLFGGEDRRFGAYSYDPELYRYKLLGFDLLTESTIFPGTKYPAAEEPKYYIRTCDFGFGVKVHYGISKAPDSTNPLARSLFDYQVTIQGTHMGRGATDACNNEDALHILHTISYKTSKDLRGVLEQIPAIRSILRGLTALDATWYNSTITESEYQKLFS